MSLSTQSPIINLDEDNVRINNQNTNFYSNILKQKIDGIPIQIINKENDRYSSFGYFKCAYCINKFFKRCQLVKHIYNFHNKSKNKFNCNFCSKPFFDHKMLVRHKKKHRGNRFQCDICKMNFIQTKDLKNHKKLHSDIQGKNNFSCKLTL